MFYIFAIRKGAVIVYHLEFVVMRMFASAHSMKNMLYQHAGYLSLIEVVDALCRRRLDDGY